MSARRNICELSWRGRIFQPGLVERRKARYDNGLAHPRIDFLFFDAGGGHRAAATALDAIARQQSRPWEVRLVDLNDILGRYDILKKLTGQGLEDIYNIILARGWTLGSTQMLPVMQLGIGLFHGQHVKLMSEFWSQDTPDMVVSVVPNFNRALYQAYRAVRPRAPYVTTLTDLADYPPHFWMEPGQDQYFICGSPKAVDQARAMGYPADRVLPTSGMILRPSFYDVAPIDRPAARQELGLDPALPTALVLFGGHGAPVIANIVRDLEPLAGRLQLIVMCGHNEGLAGRLRSQTRRLRVHIEGFTKQVPRFMQMADFMIGKPGPGSVSEAIQMGLPVIVERNAWTLPQERYNADWIRERQVGFVLDSFRHIRKTAAQLAQPATLAAYRSRARAIHNQAIFEIPDLLQRLLDSSVHN
jgi:hypothetical protein